MQEAPSYVDRPKQAGEARDIVLYGVWMGGGNRWNDVPEFAEGAQPKIEAIFVIGVDSRCFVGQ